MNKWSYVGKILQKILPQCVRVRELLLSVEG